ncbi:AAA family ATPase [Paenibacillus piri]|uniref:AAA family ATPase n=1 Tax=Paenibacillus piri TaxID=2547395 RepID=A0A4R5KGP4_9BACL|nr:AAA family ATPase [Paenibacillus piri]TDF93878.1 AAA family ATPase [Paenibacillus piri]
MFLREITILREKFPSIGRYPFSVPALAGTRGLRLREPVTFFVGENGSGKSTLLEAVAWQCGFHTAGGSTNQAYELEGTESDFGPFIRLSWSPKVTNGFFLRAESFFGFANYLDQMVREQPGYRDEFYAPYGGKSLHEQSHGESFLSLFRNRFGRKAIYLLDEPEAALSPARQLSLLSVFRRLSPDSQFIVATHSPILLGYPDAQIYSFDEGPIREIDYEETSHYQLTRRFLENRGSIFRELFAEDEEDGE